MRPLAYSLYLRVINLLLRMPGHAFRRIVFARVVRATTASRVTLERGVRVTAKGGVAIGSDSIVNSGVLLDGRGGLDIGERVNISPDVLLLTAEHDLSAPDFAGVLANVIVEDRVWIAARAMILPGTVVGEGAVVGAGAVVRGTVEPWSVVVGNPAHQVGTRPRDAQNSLPAYRRWFH